MPVVLDDAAAFMPEDDWKEAFRIRAGQGKRIGMADAGGDDSHQATAPMAPLIKPEAKRRRSETGALTTSCHEPSLA